MGIYDLTKHPKKAIPQGQAQMNVDLSQCPDICCTECDCAEFEEIIKMKYASKLQSPIIGGHNRGETVAHLKIIRCRNCSTVFNIEKWMKQYDDNLKEKINQTTKE
jgi:hypothetical protein